MFKPDIVYITAADSACVKGEYITVDESMALQNGMYGISLPTPTLYRR